MSKKGKDKSRPWLSPITLLPVMFLIFAMFYWYITSQTSTLDIEYGKLMAMLQADDPGLRFQSVRVDRGEVRGKLLTSDPVSDGSDKPERLVQVHSFRTRTGPLDQAELLTRL